MCDEAINAILSRLDMAVENANERKGIREALDALLDLNAEITRINGSLRNLDSDTREAVRKSLGQACAAMVLDDSLSQWQRDAISYQQQLVLQRLAMLP